jgi:hypothetical protein
MRYSRRTIAAIAAAAIIAAGAATVVVAATTVSHPKHQITQTAARARNHVAAACPAVIRAAHDVARKAGIDLSNGFMRAGQFTRRQEIGWSSEIGRTYQSVPHPAVADITLGEDLLTAQVGALFDNDAGAQRFIEELQQLLTDCHA